MINNPLRVIMSIKNELGKKIKKLRKSKKLTQEQLAEKINVSPRAISGIELGEYYPKAETIDKILNLFDISSEELFSNEDMLSKEILYNKLIENIKIIASDEYKLKLCYNLVKSLMKTL